MNKAIKPAILPYITLGAGAAGAALRFWLLASANGAHLLPAGHPARTLPVILSLLLLAVLFIGTRPLVQAHKYGFNFPASLASRQLPSPSASPAPVSWPPALTVFPVWPLFAVCWLPPACSLLPTAAARVITLLWYSMWQYVFF